MLKHTPLYRGFIDVFLGNPHRVYDSKDRFALSDQSEYDTGYRGGMFALLCGEDYFRQDRRLLPAEAINL